MPIPILIVFSWKKRATDIGEKILTEIKRALKTFGVEWSAESTERSPSMFRAICVFKPLDYDLKENEKRLEWGLKECGVDFGG